MTNANANAIMQQAQALIKAGRKQDARPLLERLVQEDDQSEQGWLFLSACVDSLDEQRICLENVLMLNPNNQKAQKGLETVKQKLIAQRPAAPPQPSYNYQQPEENVDFGSPYDDSMFNSGVADPSPESPWDTGDAPANFAAPSYDDQAIATSVDWGRGSAPAYGSGQNVPQPTQQEFDSWVAKLPLGGKAKEPEARVPQTTRSTTDLPPQEFLSTEEQFNIPSAYDGNDDPFRASFDFSDGIGAPAAPPPQKSVSPFDLGDDAALLNETPNFEFGDFGGPFSANTGSSIATPAPTPSPVNDYGDLSDSRKFNFDFSAQPSYTENYADSSASTYEQSGTSFEVPGGYSNADMDSSAGYAPSSNSGDRFKFGNKSQRRGVELPGSSGLFNDNPLDSNPDMSPAVIDFGDDDELAGASGVFGMAARKNDSRPNRTVAAQQSPSAVSEAAAYDPTPVAANTGGSGRYRAVPADIKAKGSGGGLPLRALAVILILLVLNVISILVLLFFNLRGLGIV